MEDDKKHTLSLYFDIWNEFCHPQGFKGIVTLPKEPSLEVSLKNKMKIMFNENISGEFINTNDLFSNLFVSSRKDGLELSQISKLNEELKKIVEPYKYCLLKKRDETHSWFISVKNVPDTKAIKNIIWKFNVLINILTNDFNAKIDMVKLEPETQDAKMPKPVFYYLSKIDRPNEKSRYSFQISPFHCESFSKDEWKTILNKIFDKKSNDWLINFLYVLYENNSNRTFTIFHITRYIDYIGAIGGSRNYGKKLKYEQVILDYIDNLDNDLKKSLLKIFRENLAIIKVSNNANGKLRNWKLIGKKLSEFRAYAAHVEEKKETISFFKAYRVYKILELIIIDYVFELLGMNIDKRKEYKTHYLKQI